MGSPYKTPFNANDFWAQGMKKLFWGEKNVKMKNWNLWRVFRTNSLKGMLAKPKKTLFRPVNSNLLCKNIKSKETFSEFLTSWNRKYFCSMQIFMRRNFWNVGKDFFCLLIAAKWFHFVNTFRLGIKRTPRQTGHKKANKRDIVN
jgi:hypothetical protein